MSFSKGGQMYPISSTMSGDESSMEGIEINIKGREDNVSP
jgi:hypothetical protein